MGLEMCVLEALDDVLGSPLSPRRTWLVHLAKTRQTKMLCRQK